MSCWTVPPKGRGEVPAGWTHGGGSHHMLPGSRGETAGAEAPAVVFTVAVARLVLLHILGEGHEGEAQGLDALDHLLEGAQFVEGVEVAGCPGVA